MRAENRHKNDFYQSISGLVVEYIVAIDVTRVRFPADAFTFPRCAVLGAERDAKKMKGWREAVEISTANNDHTQNRRALQSM